MSNIPRQLGNYYVSGNSYDSYATAWRYLGTYIDCQSGRRDLYSFGSGSGMSNYYRNKNGNSGGNSYSSSKKCNRKLLWAAYYDPNYSGGEIGEYQFYANSQWDSSTCQSGSRCAKMDCHDPYNSNWELIGVYKESVSFEDDTWFEQLFKHQGYCLWDGDKEDDSSSSSTSGYYQFMQSMRQELPSGCTKSSVFKSFGYGTYYIDIKPMENGQMTLGVYSDSSCKKEASYSFTDYQQYLSSAYEAITKSGAFDTWNNQMYSYKICQPCRAYNRQQTYDRRDRDLRFLGEDNDGQGQEESNGYNCYDDAGYQNCNQCFKFETHTDIEEASSSDLALASNQGTILKIKVNGNWYGSGTVGDVQYVQNSYSNSSETEYAVSGGAAFFILGLALWGVRRTTTRRIALVGDEGTAPSTTSPPLV